jgi:replicative DNA helicase
MSTYEQALLGCILTDSTLIDEMDEYCTIEDFEDQRVQFCIKTAKQIAGTGGDVNLVSMRAHIINETGSIDRASALLKYLAELMKNTGSTATFRDHAVCVRQEADTRRLIAAADDVLQIANDSKRSLSERLDACQQKMLDAVERREDTLKDSKQQLKELIDDLEQKLNNGGAVGLDTGFDQIDEKILKMKSGQLIILAGRPSMGKSVLALNIFSNAIKAGQSALYVSLEMMSNELTNRLASDWANVELDKFSTGKLDTEDWGRFTNVFGAQYSKLNGVIDDSSTQTIGSIRAKARRVSKKNGGLGLLIVDHIGLIDHGYENDTAGLSKISRELKRLAKDLDCPILALSQLNRSCEQRPNKRPMLSDLRQSGTIEQDADVVMMLYRDEYYNSDSPNKGIAELMMPKIRGGKVGTALLRSDFEFGRFKNTDSVFDESMIESSGGGSSRGLDY